MSFDEARPADPARVAISRIWSDDVVEAPRGAWPCGCHSLYDADLDAVRRWAREGATGGVELLAP